jgi:hypothetical protein
MLLVAPRANRPGEPQILLTSHSFPGAGVGETAIESKPAEATFTSIVRLRTQFLLWHARNVSLVSQSL